MKPTRLLLGLSVLLSGCAGLPPRTGSLAGDVRYSWVSKTPQGVLCSSNCWGKACTPFTASVTVQDGKVTSATCAPSKGP